MCTLFRLNEVQIYATLAEKFSYQRNNGKEKKKVKQATWKLLYKMSSNFIFLGTSNTSKSILQYNKLDWILYKENGKLYIFEAINMEINVNIGLFFTEYRRLHCS